MRAAAASTLFVVIAFFGVWWGASALGPAPVPAVATRPAEAPGQAAILPRVAPTETTALIPAAPTIIPATPPAMAAATPACASDPNALGISRVVEIDTAAGPGFGWEHFKMHDSCAMAKWY
jgi:hypothetical protein